MRSKRSMPDLVQAVRQQLHYIDAGTPIWEIETMDQIMRDSVTTYHLAALLLTIFASLAMMLALVGVYGVMNYAVSQRVREIGVRMVLGADRKLVLRLVPAKSALLAGFGVAGGILASLALTRFLSNFLFGVGSTDASTFAVVSLVLSMTALLACYIPGLRATKIDPIVALRYE